MSAPRTVCEAFERTVAERADEVALRTLGGAEVLTWADYGRRARALAAGLIGLGVERGDTVGLMLVNRPEFNLSDTAATLIGATTFSVYATASPEQVGNVLRDSGARIVVTEPQFLDQIRASGAAPEHVLLVTEDAVAPDDTIPLAEIEQIGEAASVNVAAISRAIAPDDVLCLIYTSGTTGVSKGVQLTHANILAEAEMFAAVVPVAAGSRTVSFLPSAHIGDRFLTHYNGIVRGLEVTTCPSMLELGEHLVDARPQFLPSVPRVWEKVRSSIEASYRQLGDDPEARRFWAALESGVVDDSVMAPLRERLGLDELEHCVVGGAAGAAEMLEFFAALGVELLEVWGMTETTAVATVNPPGAARFGSVGKPLPGVEIRLAEDGELLVKGANVTRGYRNMPAETEAAIIDGWLATGDVARLDEDGYLWIVDRKKDLIINAAGKNMSPTHIETVLKSTTPLIAEACVIGDARPFNTALVVLDQAAAADLARPGEGGAAEPATLAADPTVVAEVGKAVEVANARLARVEQIKRWKLLPTEWAPGGEEMTLSMKLKRRPIAEKYRGEIDELYAEAPSESRSA